MKEALKKWFIILGVLAFIVMAGCLSEEHRNSKIIEAEIEVAHIEIRERGTIIAQQEETIREQAEVLTEALKRLSLLVTFQDAGFNVTSSEVRDLLSLANTLPYGSPFPDGHRITSRFGMRSVSRYGWLDQKHLGIDLLPLTGDPTIIAPVDGYITDHGWSDLYGNYIEMQTVTGYRLFLAHLSRIYWPHVDVDGNWSIDPEQIVKKGTRIATMGQTGQYATGPHLHFEIWIQTAENGWVPLDPEEIIKFTGGTE